jgi:hypothetical protein
LACNVLVDDVDEHESTNEHFHLLFLLKFGQWFANKYSTESASNTTSSVSNATLFTEIATVPNDVTSTVGGTQSNKSDWELIDDSSGWTLVENKKKLYKHQKKGKSKAKTTLDLNCGTGQL